MMRSLRLARSVLALSGQESVVVNTPLWSIRLTARSSGAIEMIQTLHVGGRNIDVAHILEPERILQYVNDGVWITLGDLFVFQELLEAQRILTSLLETQNGV